jgi:hypothetical protein
MSNGSYDCEEKRLDEIYNEEGIVGKKMIVIRWNPHSYEPPYGGPQYTLEERLALFVRLKLHLRKKPPNALISVFYMFYDEDNEKLCENYPRHMIYDPSDFP